MLTFHLFFLFFPRCLTNQKPLPYPLVPSFSFASLQCCDPQPYGRKVVPINLDNEDGDAEN